MLISFVLAVQGAIQPNYAWLPNDAAQSAAMERFAEAAWQEVEKPIQKISKEEKRHQDDLKGDAEAGAKFAERADKEFKASTNQEYIDRVNRIGQELAAIARQLKPEVLWGDKRLNPYEYKFKVVENKEVNAFSLPGGYIYVYDGLVKFVESDDELAGVLAHEVAHASLRHLATLQREQSKLDVFTLPLILVSLLAGGEGGAAGVTLGSLANQALASGWGQNAERAADYAGFQYMQKSPYNPVGMITFMEKLARDQRTIEAVDWGIYRTHPPSKERAASLERYVREAGLPLKRSQVTTSYRVTTKPDSKGNIQLMFNGRNIFTLGGIDAKTRAESLAPKLSEFFDDVPELFEVSVKAPSTVTYLKKPILNVTEEDAKVLGQTVEDATSTVVKAIKRELYLLAFRVWDAR